MRPLRIAVATSSLSQPFRPSLQTAAEIGADGVQLDVRNELKPTDLTETGRREFLHQLDLLGLSIASLAFPVRRAYYEQEQLEARVAGTRAAMLFASQLKCRLLTLRAGRIPDDENSAEYQLLREVVNDLARYGNHIGVTLALTPMRDRPEALDQFLRGVTLGPVGVNFDPAAFVVAGESPGAALRALHALVVHVQVRDALRDVDGGGREVAVGRGEVEWDEFFALLDEADYRGWFTVDRTQGDDRRRDVASAVQFVRRVGMG